MKWIGRVTLTLVAILSIGWVFRAELVLSGVAQMKSAVTEVGPTIEIEWSTGADSQGRAPSNRPPNIVLIVADDMGWNDISMNSLNSTAQTPNIDVLAAEGVAFSQGYAAHASCAPSRAALMSGRYGTRFGFEFTPTPPGFEPVVGMLSDMMDRPLQPPAFTNPQADTLDSLEFAGLGMPPSEITLAELLADQGYHTAHIGKWHLGEENGMAPHDQGFAESILMVSGLYGRLDDENIIQARQDFDPIDRFLWRVVDFAASFNGGPWFEPPKYLTDYYTDEAVKVIEANKDRPFFLYLAHWAPHTPLQASREDYEALSHIELHRERVYAAMIRSLDRGVGRVMAALKANGLDENTLVIFTSDNGGAGYIGLPNVNAPYRGWKSTLFEGGIRVPFLARWPAKLPAGEIYDAPVHHVDIYATAAAAAAADLPADRIMDGVNLTPYVTPSVKESRRMDSPHEYLFFRGGAAQAVRDKRWKLVVSAPPQSGRKQLPRKEWLFDLSAQGEQVDLLAKHPQVANRLRGALEVHNEAQAEPLWPWITTKATNIDRDLSQQDQPEDEFIYMSN
ncbi:sulfatase-like hydrolase/transferase [uncultured Oceanicoccus sp.]|uniref:sulfatase-like hydrolase/transferase n=1 Tax=uncultured Oceanicoccus sp. TaxID=1706381 RepID=UPI0030DCD3AB